MQCNVGKTDQKLRIIVGLALIGWGLMTQNWLGAIGLVPLATGILRFCPAYLPLGIKTGCGDKMKTKCCGGGCHSKEPPQEQPQDSSKP